jgi:hypothetical protein
MCTKRSLPLISDKSVVCISNLIHSYYMAHPSHSLWFDHPSKIWLKVPVLLCWLVSWLLICRKNLRYHLNHVWWKFSFVWMWNMVFRIGSGMWNGFFWPRIGPSGELLWTRKYIFGFHKKRGIYWLVLASRKGLCSMESARELYSLGQAMEAQLCARFSRCCQYEGSCLWKEQVGNTLSVVLGNFRKPNNTLTDQLAWRIGGWGGAGNEGLAQPTTQIRIKKTWGGGFLYMFNAEIFTLYLRCWFF